MTKLEIAEIELKEITWAQGPIKNAQNGNIRGLPLFTICWTDDESKQFFILHCIPGYKQSVQVSNLEEGKVHCKKMLERFIEEIIK